MECARRAVREPLRRRTVDSTVSLCTVVETVRNDAVDSSVCRCSGSQIRRLLRSMRTPVLVFAWSARGVRLASRCGGIRSV
eukprot:2526237-Lingulodinium_polyedra.AAC.1